MSRAMALAAASSALVGAGVLFNNSTSSNSSGRIVTGHCTNRSLNQVGVVANRFWRGRPAFTEPSNSARFVTRAAASASSVKVAEPSTGIEFSKAERLPGASTDLSLLGVGVREKKIAFIAVKVYAVGFYANQEQLSQDPASSISLSKGAFEKGLVIKLARDVDGATFCSALDEELKPRMTSRAGGEQVLGEFGKTFKDRSLKKGTSIYFTWIQPDTLHVGISDDGSVLSSPTSTFESNLLASALFDVYLGDKPVSPSLKSSVADCFEKIH